MNLCLPKSDLLNALRIVALGIALAVAPVGFHMDFGKGFSVFSVMPAYASGGDDDDDDDDRRGRGRGRGGDDDDDDDDDEDRSGSNSGSGSGSGGGGGDDSGGASNSTTPSTKSNNGTAVWTVAWYRVNGQDIEVHYTDGWTEMIRGNRYVLIDERNRVAIDRNVRASDRARLAPLLR